MDNDDKTESVGIISDSSIIKNKNKRAVVKYSIKRLKKQLAKKPEIFHYILQLRECLLKRKKVIRKLKHKLDKYTNKNISKDASSQTEEVLDDKNNTEVIEAKTEKNGEAADWKFDSSGDKHVEGGTPALSIAEQVKEAAESALQQTGMVYEATSGMYYDYNTGYYYNAESGLYYHGTTGCYYYFDKEQNQFVFHSQPDTSQQSYQHHHPSTQHSSGSAGGKKKHRKESRRGEGKKRTPQEELENDHLKKKPKRSTKNDPPDKERNDVDESKRSSQNTTKETLQNSKSSEVKDISKRRKNSDNSPLDIFASSPKDSNDDAASLEDGECPASDGSKASSESSDSESDDSLANRYPPCMRIIVQETPVCKLKVGSLFLLTKDGGTLGREGNTHSIVIPEENVSRHHLTFSYDDNKHLYLITDMGSRNGTLLNGKRMSAAQRESEPMEIVHGSVIQLGGTKLLCHIHSGTATCGHCEPGLLIRDSPPPSARSKEYKSTNLKKEYKKEIQRLKTKYKITPPKEEEIAQMPEGYEDKARKRREEVGSIHHGAKTEQASLDTSIASTNKGFKMLEKMGWKAGDGLGKDAKGEQEPVPLVSNVGTAGLGCETLATGTAIAGNFVDSKKTKDKAKVWLATQKRFNMLPTPKAFADDDDSEEDG